MEKLLNMLSNKLQIRTHAVQQVNTISSGNRKFVGPFKRFEYIEVPNEVKTLFKEKLEAHIFSKADQIEAGEKLEYSFDYGNARPLGTLMNEANDNVAEVLLGLPKLCDGECYVLPLDTYFCFVVTEKSEIGTTLELANMSGWIKREYNN